jgi:hypothetical protein
MVQNQKKSGPQMRKNLLQIMKKSGPQMRKICPIIEKNGLQMRQNGTQTKKTMIHWMTIFFGGLFVCLDLKSIC